MSWIVKFIVVLFCGCLTFFSGWFYATPLIPLDCPSMPMPMAPPAADGVIGVVDRESLRATVLVKEEDSQSVAISGGKGYRMERERSKSSC